MSTADKLNALVLTKTDIKLALIDKGLNPTDVFSTYADDIRAIETNSGRDWSVLGYNAEPDLFDDGVNYGASLLERVKRGGNDKNILNELYNNKILIYLPNFDWVLVGVNYSGAKADLIARNANLEYVDIMDLSKPYLLGDIETYYLCTYLFNSCPKLKKVKHLILPEKEDGVDLSYAFYGCNSLTDINITGKVNNLSNTFSDTQLNKVPVFDTTLCTTMLSCFSGCCSIEEADLSKWDFSNVKTLRNLFFYNSSSILKKVDFTNFNAPKCTLFDQMFYNCSKLEELIIPDGFGKGVLNYYAMFRGCNNLPIEQISTKLDTSDGTNFGSMFMYFTKSTDTELDLSWLNISNATSLNGLVYGCSSLLYLNLTGLDTRNADINSLIGNCSNLIKIDGELSIYSTIYLTSYNWLVGYSALKNLRYLTLKDIGESGTGLSMKNVNNWGIEDETIELSTGARKSMIDSLIKYSYDRVSNGLSAYEIILSTNTKDLLTEDEIAQITAKGYTIA